MSPRWPDGSEDPSARFIAVAVVTASLLVVVVGGCLFWVTRSLLRWLP